MLKFSHFWQTLWFMVLYKLFQCQGHECKCFNIFIWNAYRFTGTWIPWIMPHERQNSNFHVGKKKLQLQILWFRHISCIWTIKIFIVTTYFILASSTVSYFLENIIRACYLTSASRGDYAMRDRLLDFVYRWSNTSHWPNQKCLLPQGCIPDLVSL